MARKNFLNNLIVPSPCNADWNAMKGNERVRFCEHCNLDVHNISLMTRTKAQRLVERSNGRLCVRYHSNPTGKPLTMPLSQKLHRINRRVSRIAAGAFSATLSITSAVAQSSVGSQTRNLPNAVAVDPRQTPGAGIAGTVTDQNGAVISGATIFVSNQERNIALYASTGFDGQFKIDNLESGIYKIRIEAPGFAPEELESIYVQGNNETRLDRTLKIATVEETVEVRGSEISSFSGGGAIAFVSASHPFVRAAQEDDLEALTALIAGMDVNLRDEVSGTTALEHAVKNANREMVQLLLSAGANVNARNAEDETVLMMIDEDSTSDLIWDLINAGADVKLKDKSGLTALMHIAGSKNVEAIKTLLDAGAEVNAKNEQGQTALMLAASEGMVNNVRALVLAGADIDPIDEDGMNALAHAQESEHPAVVRFLKSKGAVTIALPAKEE